MGAMLKKYLLLSGIAAMLTAGLAGCGNRNGQDTSTNSEQGDYPKDNHSNVNEEKEMDQNKDINNDEDGEIE